MKNDSYIILAAKAVLMAFLWHFCIYIYAINGLAKYFWNIWFAYGMYWLKDVQW